VNAERWRSVPGYEGLYEVSDHGRVRSFQRPTGPVILSPAVRKGYAGVTLTRNKQPRVLRVNRLVAMAFHGLPEEGQVCRHLNGNSLDNRAVNLAWGSHKENVADLLEAGGHYNQRKTHCLRGHPFTPENTRVSMRPAGPLRSCRRCGRDHARRYRAERSRRRAA
jgi:hypothetical protein